MKPKNLDTIMHCEICGGDFQKHKLNRLFTGRIQLVCDECMKNGRNKADAQLHSHYRKYGLK